MNQRKHHPDQVGGPAHDGRIKVAVRRSTHPTPRIAGFRPTWVVVNLNRDPQKVVTYRPVR